MGYSVVNMFRLVFVMSIWNEIFNQKVFSAYLDDSLQNQF